MTRDDILRMAREAGLFVPHAGIPENGALTRFAALVAAAEREACAEAALAEPVEPVAWGVFGANLHDMFFTEEEAHEMAMLKGDGSTVAPLYASPPQRPAEPVQEPYTGDVTRIIREAGMTFHLGLPHKPVIEQMTRVIDLVYAEASIKAAQQFAAPQQRPAEPVQEPVAVVRSVVGPGDDGVRIKWLGGFPQIGDRLYTSPQQHPAEPVQCDPQYAVTEDGYCEWVCPVPNGYLMQCCDCGLIHEVDFRVVRYEPQPSEDFVVIDGPNMQAQLRMRRRDDLSPKKSQEPVAWYFEARHIDSAWGPAVSLKHPGAEGVYLRKVTPLYAAPPQRLPLTEDQLDDIAVAARRGNLHDLRIAIEAAIRTRSKT